MAAALTFWACGGDVLCRIDPHPPTVLPKAAVIRLANQLWDEQIAARKASDRRTEHNAEALCGELLDAHTQASRWRRCASSGFSGALVDQSEQQTKGEAA